ncbi:MAG TPA: hypothetical protein VLB27_04090 [candidate division Zixibacteria bacterium]|nr:hypothetical protein [candidate division Zixibacteria bacterium]
MKRICKHLVVALGLTAIGAMLTPSASQAQDVANGSATATVQAVLTVTATQALAFGNVFQGVTKAIANNNASAGVFTITGQASSGVSIYMQLPDYLATSTGDDRMVIAFSSTDASVDTTGNSDPTAFGSGWQNTNPHAFPSATVVGAGGQTDIFLGGRVNPSVDQTAGAYTADVILTVAYNGS